MFVAIGLRLLGNRRIRSVFGIVSVFGFEVQIKLGQYLGWVCQHLGSKFSRSVFGIEVEIEVDRT